MHSHTLLYRDMRIMVLITTTKTTTIPVMLTKTMAQSENPPKRRNLNSALPPPLPTDQRVRAVLFGVCIQR